MKPSWLAPLLRAWPTLGWAHSGNLQGQYPCIVLPCILCTEPGITCPCPLHQLSSIGWHQSSSWLLFCWLYFTSLLQSSTYPGSDPGSCSSQALNSLCPHRQALLPCSGLAPLSRELWALALLLLNLPDFPVSDPFWLPITCLPAAGDCQKLELMGTSRSTHSHAGHGG